MSDLLPCPFCGSGQEHLFVDTSYHGFAVSCEECSGSASMRDWESRSEMAARNMADRIEQLQRQLAEARIDAGIQECLAVSQYKAGVRVGWNLGVSDNHDGMVRASEGTEHIAELNRLKAARAAIRERT